MDYKTTTSDRIPDDDFCPITEFHDPYGTAEMLARHLGGSLDQWLIYLRDDRHPAVPECDREFPFDLHDGEFWYDMRDIYRFIRRRNPVAFTAPGEARSSDRLPNTFGIEAVPAVDFANACRLVVEFAFPETFFGRPQVTPQEAEALGSWLVQLGKWCEAHAYDPSDGVCKPKMAGGDHE